MARLLVGEVGRAPRVYCQEFTDEGWRFHVRAVRFGISGLVLVLVLVVVVLLFR